MKLRTDWIEKRQALRTDADRMLSNLSPTETAPLPASSGRMEIGHQLPRIGPHLGATLTYTGAVASVRKLRKHAA